MKVEVDDIRDKRINGFKGRMCIVPAVAVLSAWPQHGLTLREQNSGWIIILWHSPGVSAYICYACSDCRGTILLRSKQVHH